MSNEPNPNGFRNGVIYTVGWLFFLGFLLPPIVESPCQTLEAKARRVNAIHIDNPDYDHIPRPLSCVFSYYFSAFK